MTTAQAVKKLTVTFGISEIYANRVLREVDQDNFIDSASRIITLKPKPFVKWVGGKRQLLGQFRSLGLYPPTNFDSSKSTYYEPFVGGGAVYFDLLPEKAVLSDLNNELVKTYNVIKNNPSNLISDLKKHINTKEYFLDIRSLNPELLSDLEVASRFIYLNRTCFNGMYRVNSRGGFNVPYGKYNNPNICDEENILKVSKALSNVSITNEDYKSVLPKVTKGDFVYFDPPYYPINQTSSFTSYTKEAFLEKQQIELRNLFYELSKKGCYVMLSNSNTDFIKSIYNELRGIFITNVSAARAINSNGSKRGKISELLITNYKPL